MDFSSFTYHGSFLLNPLKFLIRSKYAVFITWEASKIIKAFKCILFILEMSKRRRGGEEVEEEEKKEEDEEEEEKKCRKRWLGSSRISNW